VAISFFSVSKKRDTVHCELSRVERDIPGDINQIRATPCAFEPRRDLPSLRLTARRIDAGMGVDVAARKDVPSSVS
jgi:hypothetical protein